MGLKLCLTDLLFFRHMGSKTLKPDWITDSILAGVKLDPRKYFLYNSNEYDSILSFHANIPGLTMYHFLT